jgi:HK97 gp10 family phage protein
VADSAITVDSDAALKALARVLPVARENLGRANQQTGATVRTIAQSLVPVQTGNLKSAIVETFNPETGTAVVGVRGGRVTGERGRTVNPATYGRHVHNGTIYMRGRPFMAQAAERGRAIQIRNAKDAGRDIERDMAP